VAAGSGGKVAVGGSRVTTRVCELTDGSSAVVGPHATNSNVTKVAIHIRLDI
jgi:hypothetical protein